MSSPILELRDVKTHFPLSSGFLFKHHVGTVKAVDGVTLSVAAGEVLGLVGESGCGKSTLARTIMQLVPTTAGTVILEGKNLTAASADSVLTARRHLQMVFQDPYASLNPRMTIGAALMEPMIIHNLGGSRDERLEMAGKLMKRVNLDRSMLNRYPHEFSGGQRQRIGIARALAVSPKLVVCDEAVSALDVSIQAQVINLLEDLQSQFNLTYLFIAHDLSVVEHISDRVAVMYLGRIVEIASSKDLYTRPQHPYTEALLSAVPIPDPQVKRRRIPLQGDVPNPIRPPSGCHFHTRCPIAQKGLCDVQSPVLKPAGADGHMVACHLRPA